MSLQGRIISTDSDLQSFDALAQSKGDLFSSVFWINLFDDAIRIGFFRADNSLAAACVLHHAKLKFISLTHPLPFSPHCALIMDERQKNPAEILSFRKEVLSAFADFLRRDKSAFIDVPIPPAIIDTQPLIWSGFQVRPAYTYRINLLQEESQINASFAARLRNSIRKEDSIYKVLDASPEQAFDLISKTLLRNGLHPDLEAMKRIIFGSHAEALGFGLIALEGTDVQAAAWFVGQDKEAHYLFGGTSGQSGGPGLLIWSAIKKLRNQGFHVLDLEGSMQPGIEQFFRSFGAEMTPYYRVRKAGLWVEVLLRLFKPSIWR